MTTWILEPRDTLLVRDARPSTAAGALRSLDFPWPSSLAGLLRTRIGTNGTGYFDPQFAEPAKQITVRGPLLAELNPTGEMGDFFAPAPSDCVWYRELAEADGSAVKSIRRRLEPVNYREDRECEGFQTDLDTKVYGREQTKYLLRHGSVSSTTKPVPGCAFWRWADLQLWLEAPASEQVFPEHTGTCNVKQPCFQHFGLPALVREQRTHVSIDAGNQTAADGMLFTTESLRFTKTKQGSAPKEFGLLFTCDNPYQEKHPLNEGIVTFGGEHKLSFLSKSKQTLPAIPPRLVDALEKSRQGGPFLARVVLLTPALFEDGFAPKWIGDKTAKVVAAAVQRPQIVSGWDFATQKPKANRRMAPAGSVYWVELPDGLNVAKWLDLVWMKCLTNQLTEQDPRDGFGLCAVGVG